LAHVRKMNTDPLAADFRNLLSLIGSTSISNKNLATSKAGGCPI
jgi:hypothetical protein